MVRIERVIMRKPEPEPTLDQYNLIEVYVSEPAIKPNSGFMVQCRPYEFEGDKATKYMTTCPHCSQLIQFDAAEAKNLNGLKFVMCRECGAGAVKETINKELVSKQTVEEEIPEFEDPFVNPLESGLLTVADIDTDLVNTLAELDNDGLTVAERMQRGQA